MTAITLPQAPITYDGHALSMVAEAALNEAFACVINGTAGGTVIQSSAANQVGIGFAKYETGSTFSVGGAAQVPVNTVVPVFTDGSVWAVAGAAIAKGARLTTAPGGQVVTAVAGQSVVAIALSAAAAQHELVAVLVTIATA